VRQLVHAHGGRIDVASEVGTGTTFTVELPRDERIRTPD
jgi:signal transduction histidine kinase